MANPPDSGSGKPPGGKPPTRPAVAPNIPPVLSPAVPMIPPVLAPIAPPAGNAIPAPGSRANHLDATQLRALEQLCAALDGMDYFLVLKLKHDASPAEIKKAFYRESRAYHPDRFYHLQDKATKQRITEVYKRVTEAYYVLRDDTKRKKYAADVTGPDRAQKLRFTEVSEAETKQAVKKEQEEQIGSHPKGRQLYATAMQDYDAQRWSAAERNLKMALTYEPQNARYKERLADVQQKLYEEFKKSGQQFKIK